MFNLQLIKPRASFTRQRTKNCSRFLLTYSIFFKSLKRTKLFIQIVFIICSLYSYIPIQIINKIYMKNKEVMKFTLISSLLRIILCQLMLTFITNTKHPRGKNIYISNNSKTIRIIN